MKDFGNGLFSQVMSCITRISCWVRGVVLTSPSFMNFLCVSVKISGRLGTLHSPLSKGLWIALLRCTSLPKVVFCGFLVHTVFQASEGAFKKAESWERQSKTVGWKALQKGLSVLHMQQLYWIPCCCIFGILWSIMKRRVKKIKHTQKSLKKGESFFI